MITMRKNIFKFGMTCRRRFLLHVLIPQRYPLPPVTPSMSGARRGLTRSVHPRTMEVPTEALKEQWFAQTIIPSEGKPSLKKLLRTSFTSVVVVGVYMTGRL